MTDIYPQITIAVVGDVHNLWDETDELVLKHLGVRNSKLIYGHK